MKCPDCGLCTIPYPNGTVRRHGPLPAKRIDAENEVERLRSAVTRLTADLQNQWRDISTAPKDGTEILALYDDDFRQVVTWDAMMDGWLVCENFYIEPTHWMPLPPAPARPEAKA